MTIGVKFDGYLFRIPFMRHTPYVALHVSHFGHRMRGGRCYRDYTIGLMWGIMFRDSSWAKWWHITSPFVERE